MTIKISISGLTALRKSLLTFAAAMGVCLFALGGNAQEAKTAGTGFVVSSDGCIATALHVTANAANLSVIFTDADGKKPAESADSKTSTSDKASKTQTSTPVFSSMTDYKDGTIVAPNGRTEK